MHIGITFTARLPVDAAGRANDLPATDDAEEEFDSPETVQAVADALTSLGHTVEWIGDGEPAIRRLLDGPRPDLIFNFAEGRGVSRSREAWIPALLESLAIPHTGSDPLTLAVTLDKHHAKILVQRAGVAVPAWVLVGHKARNAGSNLLAEEAQSIDRLPLPLIVKPAFEGSSKGVRSLSFAKEHATAKKVAFDLLEQYRQPILVEEFIDGDELTVGMIGNPPETIGVMRVLPNAAAGPFVYSLEVKRNYERQVRYECPARISDEAMRNVRTAALACWTALGCRDVSRIDFRLRDSTPYFLEANPLPGLNPKSSDLIIMSRLLEIPYRDLIAKILAAAIDRYKIPDRP